jgi:hypothetical protein
VKRNYTLGLHTGDWVVVRSPEEILATLDDRGSLDALPFMPEMLQYCGKQFQVFKSAHKTCDTIENYKTPRSMTNAVHLAGLRCDGEAHGGCQARCLLFWKEAWLKRVQDPEMARHAAVESPGPSRNTGSKAGYPSDLETLTQSTRVPATGEEIQYRCQATEMLQATTPRRWWDPRLYIKDLTSSNVRLRDLIHYMSIAAYNAVMRLNWRGLSYQYLNVRGLVSGKTPTATLNLQPGELVQVRSLQEIRHTLDQNNRNRGLSFDVEMAPYCGKTFQVLSRVERIIDEKTGKMIRIPGDCIILDRVVCGGCLSRNRLFCPRSIYPYWREIWLKRVTGE